MSELKKKPSAFGWLEIISLFLVIAFIAMVAILNHLGGGPRHTSSVNECINNLRQIDGGKQQWAMENHKGSNDVPTRAEVVIYLKNNKFPVCLKGGTYTIGRVGVAPTCSIPGHVLPTP